MSTSSVGISRAWLSARIVAVAGLLVVLNFFPQWFAFLSFGSRGLSVETPADLGVELPATLLNLWLALTLAMSVVLLVRGRWTRGLRWLELGLFPNRRQYLNETTFETLAAERNDLFQTHPKTRFISAHFGWHANDLGVAAELLDSSPNVTLELAAILYDLGRQPRAAHDFFVKYQDRILFGKDTYAPVEFPYYWRVLETKDEYFDYYRDYHAFWSLYGMDLPDDVLRKVYYENALRVTPGLPQIGWPR